MANINANDDWAAGVYQYADGDVLDGGPNSAEVLPFKQLAGRSLYQRLRNVTPWDPSLANQYGYPQFACVFFDGHTWRAKVATAVEPGTDPTKWERWGFTLEELEAEFGMNDEAVLYVTQALDAAQKKQARTNIGAMAYYGAADPLPTANEGVIFKEGVGLMVWRDTAYEELFLSAWVENNSVFSIPANATVLCSYTVPRTGKVDISGVIQWLLTANGPSRFRGWFQVNGVKIDSSDRATTDNGGLAAEGYSVNPIVLSHPVVAGDVITMSVFRQNTSASANHMSSDMQIRYIG